MSIEVEVLRKMGLSEKEAQVYLALMEYAKGATIAEIVRKAGLKRPTTYVILDALMQKGVVREVPLKAKTLYTAEDPSTLEKRVAHTLEEYRELLPFFKAKFNKGNKPYIRYYEGKEAVKRLYENEIFPCRNLTFFGTSIQKLYSQLPEVMLEWERRQREKKNGNWRVRELIGSSPEDKAYAERVAGKWEVRMLPEPMQFHADSIIADDAIFIISLEHFYAVAIESKDLTDTYRTLVEFAWKRAVPFKGQ